MEIPKKLPYISGNRNPKKLLIFWEMRLSSPSSKNNKKKPPRENFLYSNIFSKECCSYISRNGNPEKILYIAGTELS